MSEQQPYDEGMDHQPDGLPVPDQEQSWQKMKALLDKEEERRLPPPIFLRGCIGWGILIGLLGTISFFIFRPDTYLFSGKGNVAAHEEELKKETAPSKAEENAGTIKQPSQELNQKENMNSSEVYNNENASHNNSDEIKARQNQSMVSTDVQADENKRLMVKNKSNQKFAKKVKHQPTVSLPALSEEKLKQQQEMLQQDSARSVKIDPPQAAKPWTATEKMDDENREVVKENNLQVNDSINKTRLKDSSLKNRNMPEVDSSSKNKVVKKLYVSAGLGLQQQIPLGGQQSVPYDYYGRKSSLADYIPSIFIRLHKEDKWFIMGEFRYGAPQVLNEFSFSQKSVFDTSSMVLTTTTMRLKKTYYHQFPLSFNYYVNEGWSVGTGIMYSRFSGAVTESEIRNTNVMTQSESVSRKIMNVKGYTDSFLYKTQLHLMLQTDFQWKNFILGIRFAKDLQPYIRYTRPNGEINEEKNYSLQAILRYQLWRN
ncbi:MAG: hypothetical protein H0U44_01135 [Flavisolibacter sp.]|jgi:hypothetical protein|nr:hypothetical protein [Flavisolibacter sp.]